MSANILDNINASSYVADENEKFEIPIDLSDILNICKEFSRLGWQIQNQIEYITEMGIEESIKSGKVNVTSLPVIKYFLSRVNENPLFGDASEQASECIALIENFEMRYPNLFKVDSN